MSTIANIRGAIARISCRLMLSVAILRVQGLDAGIGYYSIEISGTSARGECLSDDTSIENTTREHD